MLYFYLLSFNFLGFISAMARKHSGLVRVVYSTSSRDMTDTLNQISCTFLYLMVLQHVSKYSRAFQCCIVFLLLFVTDGIKRFFVPFKTCRQRATKPRHHIKSFFPQLYITLNAYLLSLFTPNVTVLFQLLKILLYFRPSFSICSPNQMVSSSSSRCWRKSWKTTPSLCSPSR